MNWKQHCWKWQPSPTSLGQNFETGVVNDFSIVYVYCKKKLVYIKYIFKPLHISLVSSWVDYFTNYTKLIFFSFTEYCFLMLKPSASESLYFWEIQRSKTIYNYITILYSFVNFIKINKAGKNVFGWRKVRWYISMFYRKIFIRKK